MGKWNDIVNRQNKKTYIWPAGWSTAEEIAQELECEPDQVSRILKSAIDDGKVETKFHKVWDETTARVLRIKGYRKRPSATDTPAQPPNTTASAIPPKAHVKGRPYGYFKRTIAVGVTIQARGSSRKATVESVDAQGNIGYVFNDNGQRDTRHVDKLSKAAWFIVES